MKPLEECISVDQRVSELESTPSVPYFAHEGMMARNERTIKRLVIALIISIVLIFASNALWLSAWMQYDYVGSESVDIDGKNGIANYIGNDGDISNGTNSSSKSQAQEKEKP